MFSLMAARVPSGGTRVLIENWLQSVSAIFRQQRVPCKIFVCQTLNFVLILVASGCGIFLYPSEYLWVYYRFPAQHVMGSPEECVLPHLHHVPPSLSELEITIYRPIASRSGL